MVIVAREFVVLYLADSVACRVNAIRRNQLLAKLHSIVVGAQLHVDFPVVVIFADVVGDNEEIEGLLLGRDWQHDGHHGVKSD